MAPSHRVRARKARGHAKESAGQRLLSFLKIWLFSLGLTAFLLLALAVVALVILGLLNAEPDGTLVPSPP